MPTWPWTNIVTAALGTNIEVLIVVRISGWAVFTITPNANIYEFLAILASHGPDNCHHSHVASTGH